MKENPGRGKAAEDAAARHLAEKGYRIICRNYRSQRGEIDIIAQQEDTLVFVEVKMRGSRSAGYGREYVHGTKQRRIVSAALQYLAKQNWEGPCRFDVIEIQGRENPRLTHLEQAFESE